LSWTATKEEALDIANDYAHSLEVDDVVEMVLARVKVSESTAAQ
jgi:hypothetical protein